jgi:hypothetical protein
MREIFEMQGANMEQGGFQQIAHESSTIIISLQIVFIIQFSMIYMVHILSLLCFITSSCKTLSNPASTRGESPSI